MPATLMERLPLPTLKVYSSGSAVALAAAVYHAAAVTSAPGWRARHNGTREQPASSAEPTVLPADPTANTTRDFSEHVFDIIAYMMQEPLCMWTVMNMAYCVVAGLGGAVRRAALGPLRVAEAQRLKDRFWNYVFYKFIFVFGVVNVQYMDEVVAWCAWFTAVGFLHLLASLCKDRFEYITSSTRGAVGVGVGVGVGCGRVVCVVWVVCAAAGALLALAARVALPHAPDTFAFMAAECVLVMCSALSVCARHVLPQHDADAGGPLAYYTHLAFDSVSLCVEACHVGHMVVVSRAVVSLPALVLALQLRQVLQRLHARLAAHRLYTALAHHITTHYPMASVEEVAKHEDKCAICWEPLREARKLPCAHLFHNSCLCQWVQQDASCPTCRRALSAPRPARPPAAPLSPIGPLAPLAPLSPLSPLAPPDDALLALPSDPPTNHLFRFDGSRYVSWLPSFSVEVSRGGRGSGATAGPGGAEAVARMALQVQALFPQYSRAALLADLAVTRSPDLTVDNILEGRLRPSTPEPDPAPPAATPASEPPAFDPPTFETQAFDQFDTEERWADSSAERQFGVEARERENMLAARKRQLVEKARRRYLQRAATSAHPAPHTPPPS